MVQTTSQLMKRDKKKKFLKAPFWEDLPQYVTFFNVTTSFKSEIHAYRVCIVG